MNTPKDQLTGTLDSMASEVEPADADRLVTRTTLSTRATSRRRIGIGFVGGLAAAVIGSAGVLPTNTDENTPPSDKLAASGDFSNRTDIQDGIPLDIEPGTPCAGAVEMPVEQLVDQGGAPVWIPNEKGPQLTSTWLCAGEIPALSFKEGTVYYEPGWENVDVDQKWAALIRDYGGYTQEINGRTALVQPATDPGTKPQIMIVRGETLVRILGQEKAAVEPLLNAAQNLPLNESAK